MATSDPRFDAYIRKAQPFARPILAKLRALVRRGAPKATETVKWGTPFFEQDGAPLVRLAAFQRHCSVFFWKFPLMRDRAQVRKALARVASLADLPADAQLLAWVREAAALNASGAKVPRTAPTAKPPLKVPPFLARALKADAKARAGFAALPPSRRREYVEWLVEAKREETRARRLATTLEWLAKGRSRNWRYER